MGIFDFLKKKSDTYDTDQWWKTLTPIQRKLIWFKERPKKERQERLWADVWIEFTDGTVSKTERRTVFVTQELNAIKLVPTSLWRLWPQKTAQVRCVRVRPDGWDGFTVGVPMYDKHVHETDAVEVHAN